MVHLGSQLQKCLMLTVVFCSFASVAYADGGQELLYFNCQPGHALYVRGLTLFDISPIFNEKTIDVRNLQTDQKSKDCQLTPNDKVVLQVFTNPNFSKDDGFSLKLNDKVIGQYDFNNVKQSKTYIFAKAIDGTISVQLIETTEAKKRTSITP